MDFSSFVTSLATSFVIFVVLMLIFTFLSRAPGNQVIYFPSRILRGLDPCGGSRRTRNPVAWIREAIAATESDVVAAAGVDAAVYHLFLSSIMAILVLAGAALLPVLLPVAATDHAIRSEEDTKNSKSVVTFTDLDKLAMGNVHERSPRLWAFLLATYWVSFASFYVLWKAYKHASELRASAKSSLVAKPEDFAVLVRDIPSSSAEDRSSGGQVDSYFKSLHPDTFYKSLVVTDNTEVTKIYDELEGYKKKLAHAEAVFSESKTASKPEGMRPTNRTGLLGLIGEKVDSIDHCNEKIKELLPKLEEQQRITVAEKRQAAAIVIFNSKSAAAAAAQALHSRVSDEWDVSEAPEPRDLLWSNLPKRFYERQMRRWAVYGVVFLAVVFYMIPIAAVSAVTTLDNLRRLLPFLKSIVDRKAIKTVLEAFLPQLALIVFMALLPTFLMILSKLEGLPSQSHATRAAAGKYYYFIVFNVFLGVTIGGTLFSSLKTIINQPKQIVTLLGASLPGNATFFLTFVALKFFVGYGLELSRLVPLVIFHLKRRFLCKTEAEIRDAWAPPDFGYATRVPNDMLIVTIVLCYSVIAPLIIPFGVVYFGLGWLIARNQALKVYVPTFESYGRMWPHLYSRIVASLVIYQITMFAYFGLKKFVYAPFVIPLPILSCIFAYVCNKRYYPAFQHTPLEVACRDAKEPMSLEAVHAAYIPPPLRPPPKMEDPELFEDARSEASRSMSRGEV